MPQPSAGWYRDPSGAFPLRFWDGQRWTEHVVWPNRPAPSAIEPAWQKFQSLPRWIQVVSWIALTVIAYLLFGLLSAWFATGQIG
jgi:hypothetical protein